MGTRKNTFLVKRSNVAGNVPTAGQLLLGELALNTADVKLYTSGTTTNSILPIGWDRISRTGDTMSGTLYVPTISATTYQNLPNDLPTAGTTGQILAKNSNTNYDVTWIDNYTSELQHTVKAGEAISIGQAVYVSSANGTNMIVSKASNATEATSSKTLGLLAQNLALNGIGFVVTEGLLAGLNTGSATAGDPVWLGTNGNLIFGLLNKPVAPAHLVYLGVVTRAQTVNGEIFVKPQNGFEFNELHDVLLTGVTNGDLVSYDSVTSLWKNSKTLNGSYNVTGTLSATIITATTISATTYQNLPTDIRVTGGTYSTGTATFRNNTGGTFTVTGFNTGTVTSVSAGNGMNFSNFTTSGTITLGTPSSLTLSTTNTVTSNSHTHAFAPGGTTSQYITGAGTLVTFPTIPTVNDGTLTMATSGIATGSSSFTANQAGSSTFTVNVPATDLSIGVSTSTAVRVDSSTGADATLPSASSTLAGVLTATDWSTFNSKQSQLNGTGFIKANGTSITYDNSSYYLASNPNGYISSYSETDTLNSVTTRGASTTNDITIGALTVGGSLSYGSFVGTSNYVTGADNILLKGNSGGVSGIFFESEKNGTNINHPSDFGFIQYHSYGIGGTSGEANRLVIGVSNDADDLLVLNPVSNNGLVVRVGPSTTEHTIWHAGNITPIPTSRTITINGTAYDLSANRSWSVPIVTANTFNNGTYDLTISTSNGVNYTSNLGLLATDVKITGGTYNINTGVVTFTNSTGGTFNVTGFSSGMTDTFVTGGTYSSGTATFTRSNNQSFNVTGFNTGTVSSVAALTLGTTGTDLNSTVANGTTTPVITLNVPNASSTARGVLSSANWTTFNNKQPQLNGTGFVKANGTTISYDNTSYLPLIGGTLTGPLYGTVGSFSQSAAGDTLTGYNGGTGGIGINGGAANGIGGYFVNNSTTYPVIKLLGLSPTRLIEGRNTSDVITFAVTSAGAVSGSSFIRTGGTSAQFLKADGSVDSTTYSVDSNVVHKTLTENISGSKTFTNQLNTTSGIVNIMPDTSVFNSLNVTAPLILTNPLLGATMIDFYVNYLTSGTYRIGVDTDLLFKIGAPGETTKFTYSKSTGILTTSGFVKSGGTSSQFLKADGSVDSNTYATTGSLASYVPTSRTLTINGTTLDLSANRSWTVSATETDTLATVTSRGATTSTLSTFDGGLNIGSAKLRWGGNTTPTLGFPFAAAPNAFWIEVNDGDTGGLAIDNDATTIYGAGDTGHVFRVIDEDVYQQLGNIDSSTTFRIQQGENGGGYVRGSFEVTNELTVKNSIVSNQQNTSFGVGTTTVFTRALGTTTAAFFDYVATSGANARAGSVMVVVNGSTVEFTETSTNDIGTTTALTLTPALSGGNLILNATSTSGTWSLKVLARLL